MKYYTGKIALNIECDLDTCADWHKNGIVLDKSKMQDSDNSIFKDYGIYETDKGYVANHLRAILDLMEQGQCDYLKGFKNDFLTSDKYDRELMIQAKKLRHNKNWEDIDYLLGEEYREKWLEVKNG